MIAKIYIFFIFEKIWYFLASNAIDVTKKNSITCNGIIITNKRLSFSDRTCLIKVHPVPTKRILIISKRPLKLILNIPV
jgi:hypothetical protein